MDKDTDDWPSERDRSAGRESDCELSGDDSLSNEFYEIERGKRKDYGKRDSKRQVKIESCDDSPITNKTQNREIEAMALGGARSDAIHRIRT